MNKLVFTAVATTFFAFSTAYAQLPIKSDTGAVANDIVTSSMQVSALDECYSAIGDQPRTALRLCLDRKVIQAKLQMKMAYRKMESDTRSINSSSTAKVLASLRSSQRAFEGFKSAECQWKFDSAMGGSGSGDFRRSCEVDMLRWRTQQLADK